MSGKGKGVVIEEIVEDDVLDEQHMKENECGRSDWPGMKNTNVCTPSRLRLVIGRLKSHRFYDDLLSRLLSIGLMKDDDDNINGMEGDWILDSYHNVDDGEEHIQDLFYEIEQAYEDVVEQMTDLIMYEGFRDPYLGNVDMNETIDDIEKRITNLKKLFHGLKDKRIWKKRYESKGKEQVSQKVIIEESVDDRAVWDKVKISNEHLAKIKAKYVGDYKTIIGGQLKEYLDELCIMTKNEIKRNKYNDTEDDDDDYEVSKVKRNHGAQKKIASEIKRPNSAINKPKSEVRITYCILGLRAPKSVVGCSSSKRVKWADGFAPKRKSGKMGVNGEA
ncbi:hypothetical protein Tco_0305326 [Tanacetum coccineum]